MTIHKIFKSIFLLCLTNCNAFYNKIPICSVPYIYMKKESVSTFQKLSFSYTPKSVNQQLYFNALNNKNYTIVVSVGPAGTGKTLLACTTAINLLQKRQIDKIIITRPVVPVEEEIGFLPGNLVKKMDPWTRPIFDIFCEFYSNSEITQMINNNIIEISPLGFMRGRTFKNAFIIADEMQNTSPNQMFMLLTRVGENTKMILTGDLVQSDRQENNGLKDFIERYKKYNKKFNNITSISLVELNKTDIERSKIVEDVIDIYDKSKSKTIIRNSIKKSNKTNNNFVNNNTVIQTFNTLTNITKKTTTTKVNKERIYELDAALIPLNQYKDL
jgi:phosphate starvation-inducible protein PhoH and related proteins